MNQPFLPYGHQALDEDDIAAVCDVLRGDWLTTGPTVEAFETALAERVGARYAVACSSGTAALHLAMLALDIGDGDSVVVPANTFLATANAARLTGAEVVFADVDPDTGLMTAETLSAALEQGPKQGVRTAVPVHFAGQCASPETLFAIAREHGLTLVEDACHALGTTYECADGRQATVGSCRHSDMTVFSFHPVKSIAMGEGGAVTTNDDELYDRMKTFRSNGIVRDPARFVNAADAFAASGQPNPWYYEMAECGYNYRASDIHCALGLSQLTKLDRFIERRAALAAAYDRLFENLGPGVRKLGRTTGCRPAWHLYVALIDFAELGTDRATVMNRLRDRGIGTQVHYCPVSDQPYYRDRYGNASLPGTATYYQRTLSLPLFVGMEDEDVGRVVSALTEVLKP